MRAKAMPILATFATFTLGMDGAPAVAQDAPSVRQCAMRDIEVVTLIEDHGEANDIAPEQLAKAFLTQMDARVACSDDRMEDGMALYDDVFRALGPMLSQRQ
jgi:predicted lipoprotein